MHISITFIHVSYNTTQCTFLLPALMHWEKSQWHELCVCHIWLSLNRQQITPVNTTVHKSPLPVQSWIASVSNVRPLFLVLEIFWNHLTIIADPLNPTWIRSTESADQVFCCRTVSGCSKPLVFGSELNTCNIRLLYTRSRGVFLKCTYNFPGGINGIQGEVHQSVSEAFIQPQVIPPSHRHHIAKPLKKEEGSLLI